MIINDEFPLIIEQIGMHAIADQSLNTSPPFRLTTDYDRLEKMLLKYEPEIRWSADEHQGTESVLLMTLFG